MSARLPYRNVERQTRLSDQVVEQIQDLIKRGELHLGDRLPPERELAQQFNVSRTVIREAVRSLAARDLLEVRRGSGAHVSLPDASTVAESMGLILRLTSSADPFREVFEVRSLLEVEVAGLAAERATEVELADLEEQLAAMTHTADREAAAEADVEFHAQLARATHNGLFLILLDSVSDIMLEVRRRSLAVPGNKDRAIHDHSLILERVRARDAAGARSAMATHLADGMQRIQQLGPLPPA